MLMVEQLRWKMVLDYAILVINKYINKNGKQKEFLELIKKNIQDNQFHITVVQQSKTPRYVYSIGNYEKHGFELVLAGSENFLYAEVLFIFNAIASQFEAMMETEKASFFVKDLGQFHLQEVNDSWKKKMMLGVYNYYGIKNFKAYQIVPDKGHFTLDIPDMQYELNSNKDIIWKWLDDNIKWDLDVPENSTVVTEIDVLLGKRQRK